MAEEKILTQHPKGKKGVNIDHRKYDAVRAAIVGCLRRGAELTHSELDRCVGRALDGKFEGSVSWHMETVKLDLEARREIERTDTKPPRYRLAT